MLIKTNGKVFILRTGLNTHGLAYLQRLAVDGVCMSTPQQRQLYHHRQAGDADDFNPDVSSSTEVQWLGSWNGGSKGVGVTEDIT